MKTNFFIHRSFRALTPFITNISENFGIYGTTIQNGRNHVKVIELENYKIVVKSYVKLAWINRIIYGLFRKSKSQRAYENATILANNDIITPIPIGHIDYYSFGILKKSYFVSLYINCKPTKELFSLPIDECNPALAEFAKFTYRLHKLGIFHGDYGLNNVLYSEAPGGYNFCLIDNNRMRFRMYSQKRAMKNLSRIHLSLEQYAVLASEYANTAKTDAIETAHHMLNYMQSWKSAKKTKRTLKNLMKETLTYPRISEFIKSSKKKTALFSHF
jgi:tRNA A-37 threonylcarbamoyl transferase component Bud32